MARRLTEEEKQQIATLDKAGWTQTRIAKLFNVSQGTIAYHISKDIKNQKNIWSRICKKRKKEQEQIYDLLLKECEQLEM